MDFSIGDWKGHFIFLIVPIFYKDFIVGIDMLKKFGSKIHYKEHTIELKDSKGSVKIKLDENTSRVFRLIITEFSEYVNHALKISTINDTDEIMKLTDEQIDQIIKDVPHLNQEQEQKFKDLVHKHTKLFVNEPDLINIYQHELKINNQIPFICKTYPVPMAMREKVRNELHKLIGLKKLRRSPIYQSSTCRSKKNGEIRLCLDARKLIEALINDYECA